MIAYSGVCVDAGPRAQVWERASLHPELELSACGRRGKTRSRLFAALCTRKPHRPAPRGVSSSSRAQRATHGAHAGGRHKRLRQLSLCARCGGRQGGSARAGGCAAHASSYALSATGRASLAFARHPLTRGDSAVRRACSPGGPAHLAPQDMHSKPVFCLQNTVIRSLLASWVH